MLSFVLGFELKLSEVFLFFGGLALLISLPLLSGGNFTLWTVSKALYGLGVAFLLFDK